MSIEYFLQGLVGAGARRGEEPRLRLVPNEGLRVVVGLFGNVENHTVVRPHNLIRAVGGAVAKIVFSLSAHVGLRALVVVGRHGHRVLPARAVRVLAVLGVEHVRLRRVGRAVRAQQWNV